DGVYRSRTEHVLTNYYDELMVTEDGYQLKKNSLIKYKFNLDGQLVQIVNSKGEKLFLTYNTDNRLFQVLEPISGIYLRYYYNTNGSISYVQDSWGGGHSVAFTYNTTDNTLSMITDSDGTEHSFSYNSYGELTSYYIDKGSENFRYFTNTFDDLGRVKTQTTKENHITTFDYNEESANTIITTVTTPRGNTRKYKYNSTFQLLKYFDELNNLTENTYTDAGLLNSTIDPKGFVTQYTYNFHGKLEKTVYPNGAREERGYTDDGAGHIDTIRDESITTIKQYSYEGDLVKKIELNVNGDVKTILSNVYTYHYPYPDDTTTKVLKSIVSTTAKGNKTTTVYNKGRVQSVTTSEGVKTVYTHNEVGNIIEELLYNKSGALVSTTKFEYDLKSRVIKVTDAEGNTVLKTYSVFGGTKIVTDARGNSMENFYDLEGNVVKVKDTKGNFSYFNYNEDAQLLDTTDAEGNKQYISYDIKGRKAFVYNSEKERVAEYGYDILDAIDKVYAYDDNSQKVLISEHSYDVLNRTITTTSHLSQVSREITQYFDTRGRLVKHLNSARKEKNFTYENHFNTLTAVKDEMFETATQTVDNEGVIASLKDTNLNETTFQHDSTPNKTKETSALGKEHRSTYNAHQLLESFTNARGQKQELTYYKNGWLKTVSIEGKTWTYVYDANGNVLTITGDDGTISRTYDELNRVTSYSDILGKVQRYTYDKVGNLLTLTYPDGKVASYSYDSENRLSSVSFDAKKVVDYTYTRASNLKTERKANGITRTYVYHNGVGELLSITDKKADGTVVLAFLYEYDNRGNIVKETKTVEAEAEVFEYTYDDKSTLIHYKAYSAHKEQYSAFNPAMTHLKDNRLATIDSKTVSHDEDGNMLSYSINGIDRALGFDALGRLTQANDVVHEYDIENSKVKTINNGKTTKFTVNPNAKLSQLLVETLPNNDKVYHIYGIGLVATVKDTQISYYHFDYRGSTVALSSQSGTVTDTYKYLPYGSVAHHNGTAKTRFLYVGKYGIEKEASGLYYMRARYYDVGLKRFVSKDSLIGNIANSKSLNRYAYVEGNPVMGVDLYGRNVILLGQFMQFIQRMLKPKINIEKEFIKYSLINYNNMYRSEGRDTDAVVSVVLTATTGPRKAGASAIGKALEKLGDAMAIVGNQSKFLKTEVDYTASALVQYFEKMFLGRKNKIEEQNRAFDIIHRIKNHQYKDTSVSTMDLYKAIYIVEGHNFSTISKYNDYFYKKYDDRPRIQYCRNAEKNYMNMPNTYSKYKFGENIDKSCRGKYEWANPYNRSNK
ncbi:MAG: RHS repeat-associated core domain-containing protein, partial [Campylobacterota bacterium]|nr:RHS repeat-associated core domain-containing protein [Campylobacterota bacterium]